MSTGGSMLNLTCQFRAAWAGSSGSRQEGFQAFCHDPDASWTLMSCYQVCLRCLQGYLVCWGSTGALACCIFEDPKSKVILLWRRPNLEQSKLFSCGNQFLRHDKVIRQFFWNINVPKTVFCEFLPKFQYGRLFFHVVRIGQMHIVLVHTVRVFVQCNTLLQSNMSLQRALP